MRMRMIYIFDKDSRLEMWGTLREEYISVDADKSFAVKNELTISCKHPVGFILSEFISLDEMELVNIVHSLCEDDDPCFSPYRMIEPLSRVLFCLDDTTNIVHTDLRSELLYIANSIAVFREFIDLCNANRALFVNEWYKAFFEVADIFGDYVPEYIGIKGAETPIDIHGKISWIMNFRTSFEQWSNQTVNYEEENPKVNAGKLYEMMQSQIGYMAGRFSGELLFALEYSNPFYYLFESLENLISIDLLPKKCKNCGKYFIPEKRSDTIYCNRQAPQDAGVTCKTYGARKAWESNLRENETARLYRKIYMQKQMLLKRNPEIEAYAIDFENYKTQSKQWKADVKNGKKAESEYLAWLKALRRKDDD